VGRPSAASGARSSSSATSALRAGEPAICTGTVFHRRLTPVEHAFSSVVSYVWLDPDRPEHLTSHHPLWSHRHHAPARFRASDYGDGTTVGLGDQVREAVGAVLGRRPDGPIRMLTQVRRWGWLFNPITVYVVWELGVDDPVAVALEVTNTPWKERHRYVAPLAADGTARVAKVMHVSPFLDERFDYLVRLGGDDSSVALGIEVVRPGESDPVLTVGLSLDRRPVSRRVIGRALWHPVLPTHRVSFGIHRQAATLWRRGVRVVPHPHRRASRP